VKELHLNSSLRQLLPLSKNEGSEKSISRKRAITLRGIVKLMKKWIALCLVGAIALLAALPSVQAVSINSFTTDKTSYNPSDSGTATLVFLNDQGALIRITAVTMSFNSFYQGGQVYTQNFPVTGLSMNVTNGLNSQPIQIKFSLPSNIAGGYFIPSFTVTFDQLTNAGIWSGDRNANMDASTPMNINSQYVAQYQSAQTIEYVFILGTVLAMVLASYFALKYYSVRPTTTRPN
jgi:hypothetical protein